jgi:hypothetical protein
MRALFDEQGLPRGFYIPEVHGDAIPNGAVDISHAQWREFLENQGLRRWDGNAVVPYDPPPLPAPPVLVPYGDFRARWQPTELQAMFTAKNTDWRVEDYVTLASAQGHVNLSGATAAQAKTLFVALGVLTVERAETIFAA